MFAPEMHNDAPSLARRAPTATIVTVFVLLYYSTPLPLNYCFSWSPLVSAVVLSVGICKNTRFASSRIGFSGSVLPRNI